MMAVTNIYDVKYEIVKVNQAGGAGLKYVYRKGIQTARVAAASPTAVMAAVSGDVTLGSGESLEILDIHQDPVGLFT